MRRVVILAWGLAACEGTPAWEPPLVAAPAYAAASPGWPPSPTRGRFGRGEAPTVLTPLPILQGGRVPRDGTASLPALRQVTPWAVPGPGPARAVLYGVDGSTSAIDVVDIDAGITRMPRSTACKGPVVGVTSDVIVCTDAAGLTAIKIAGGTAWSRKATFLGVTDDRVIVVDETDGVVVLDANDGDELGRVVLPGGVAADELYATCGTTGRELFAARQDGTLVRIADAEGGPAIAWSVPVPALVSLDACEGDTVLARVREAGRDSLIALDRATGAGLGRVEDVRGLWTARVGEGVELATGSGVVRASRDLVTRETVSSLVLGELVAERADGRLVRASAGAAVLLDARGARGYFAFGWSGAALGDRALIAARWSGSAGNSATRLALPPPADRLARAPRVASSRTSVIVPAELRDLPAARDVAPGAVIAGGGAADYAVAAIAHTASAPGQVFAATLAEAPDDRRHGGVVGIDLEAKAVWHRADGCGLGTPVGLAAARTVVVCAAQSVAGGSVRASELDGEPLWEWPSAQVDGVQAVGDAVVVRVADRAVVLDAATGRVRGSVTSDDGQPARAVAVEVAGLPGLPSGTFVVTAEHGRLIARVPTAGLLPLWALAIDGSVAALAPLPGAVLVALDDGDAFRIDVATGAVTPLAGLGLAWTTTGDLIAGAAPGGPIPGDPSSVQASEPGAPPKRRGGRRVPPPPAVEVERPAMATPRAAPPPLGDAWHLALYTATGALRARNEYPVFPPIEPGTVRGAGASPLVVVTGPARREVLVIDPATGDPLRRVRLPDDAVPSGVGGAVVNGVPVGFVVVARPLRVVTF